MKGPRLPTLSDTRPKCTRSIGSWTEARCRQESHTFYESLQLRSRPSPMSSQRRDDTLLSLSGSGFSYGTFGDEVVYSFYVLFLVIDD